MKKIELVESKLTVSIIEQDLNIKFHIPFADSSCSKFNKMFYVSNYQFIAYFFRAMQPQDQLQSVITNGQSSLLSYYWRHRDTWDIEILHGLDHYLSNNLFLVLQTFQNLLD